MSRRRYVVCGLSNRGLASFVLPLMGGGGKEDFSAHGELVGVIDPDRRRVDEFNDRLLPAGRSRVPWFAPEQFDRMAREVAPDAVIITSPDHAHASSVVAALERDINVVVEKPMVSTAAQAGEVLAAERRSNATVHVTHNLRYTQRHRRIKQMIRDGAVGRPTHVTLEYHVDIRHGASYFLRWNRLRARSGGLSVHKSTHHLDLVSWWLDDVPERVYAVGGRNYYGADSPHRPRTADGAPITDATLRDCDPYYQAQLGSGTFPEDASIDRRGLFGLSYSYEYPAGRDRYLYDDEIDIEDTYSALVSYGRGAHLAYTIDFSSPWEGYRVVVNGTHGQIETITGRLPGGEPLPGSSELTYRPLFGRPETMTLGSTGGGHDGADPLLRRDVFIGPSPESVEVGLMATSAEGALAVATGEAIWRSIADGCPVRPADLLAQGDEADEG